MKDNKLYYSDSANLIKIFIFLFIFHLSNYVFGMPPRVGYPLEYEVEKEVSTYVSHPGNPGNGGEEPDREKCLTKGVFYDINRDGYTSVILCFRTPEPVAEERVDHNPKHPLLIFQMQKGQNYYYEGLHFVNRKGDAENDLGTNSNIIKLDTEEILTLCHRAKKEIRKYRQTWRKENRRSRAILHICLILIEQ